jgi:hypothetical protein
MAVLHYYFTVGCMCLGYVASKELRYYMNVTLEDIRKDTLLSITTPIHGDS